MSKCRKLEKFYLSGKFGESLERITNEMLEHIETCDTCRNEFEMLAEIETSMKNTQPVTLSPTRKARIRIGVMESVQNSSARFDWLRFRGWIAASAAACLLVFVVLFPLRNGLAPTEDFAALRTDDSLAEFVLDYIDEPVEYNAAVLESALIAAGDSELISIALDNWYGNSAFGYDDTVFSAMTDWDDSDWDDLRRYLI